MTNSEIVSVDSLVANEFSVEINGTEADGIFSVSGLVTYQLGGTDDGIVTITKMVQRNPQSAFNAWLHDAQAQGQQAVRNVSVIAIDDEVETRRWILKDAWIISVSYSDFNSSSIELVEERIVIGYKTIEHMWSAAG